MSPVIDRLCDELEAAWRKGRPVSIESMLQRADAADREPLLAELIRVEVALRRDAGDVPDETEYLRRFPDEAPVVRSAWVSDEELIGTIEFPTQTPDTPEAAIRPTTGSLEVTRELGRGGQADVFRGIHPTLPIEVAIKQTRQTVSRKACDALKQEADILCDLDHPHIARVRDFDFADDRPFMVLDFIRGRSLSRVAASQPLSPEEAAKLVAKLARAMAYAHARGVLHRDLKPENVVIDETGEPKIIDFGMSRLRSGMVAAAQEADEVSGTLAYMAPEQAVGVLSATDHRVDVFALGAILYRLLVGEAPYANMTLQECLARVRHGEWDTAALQTSGAPESLQAICFRAMDRAPSNRFVDAAELAEALDHTLDRAVGRKPVPLIRVFELIHIGNSANRAEFSGQLLQFRPPRVNDDIQVRAEFTAPAHCFLVALNPDGTKQLCYPAASDVPQGEAIESLRYPAEEKTAFGLTDGVGQQAFVLVASRQPLPAYDDWESDLAAADWPHPDVLGSWRYAMGELQTLVSHAAPTEQLTRGTVRETLTPTPFKALCDRLWQCESHDVQGIMFRVQQQ